jgi:nicotinamidase-related amidase
MVIDVQNDVVVNAHQRAKVVATIGGLVDNARAVGTPVIWVQHADADLPANTPGWQIVDELTPADDEPIVHKQFRDSFEQTTLEQVLTDLDVGSLIVTGSQTDFCVRWTLHGAHSRGYDTTLIADAHTTDDPQTDALPTASQTIASLNQIWGTQASEGRSTEVRTAAEIELTA